jgi:hypothetical protein
MVGEMEDISPTRVSAEADHSMLCSANYSGRITGLRKWLRWALAVKKNTAFKFSVPNLNLVKTRT